MDIREVTAADRQLRPSQNVESRGREIKQHGRAAPVGFSRVQRF